MYLRSSYFTDILVRTLVDPTVVDADFTFDGNFVWHVNRYEPAFSSTRERDSCSKKPQGVIT
ncbi:hypothetical protein WN55_09234 [Dufourea novaeangliae]|uniref:Uncharacterized protein n=1 Tax=Dufourea novaeangliae TaxID=178035 RepID=A0A154PAX1_DUFNO|nr:hypothetical protein WN55_09234 [Dufourea novaeangliae]